MRASPPKGFGSEGSALGLPTTFAIGLFHVKRGALQSLGGRPVHTSSAIRSLRCRMVGVGVAKTVWRPFRARLLALAHCRDKKTASRVTPRSAFHVKRRAGTSVDVRRGGQVAGLFCRPRRSPSVLRSQAAPMTHQGTVFARLEVSGNAEAVVHDDLATSKPRTRQRVAVMQRATLSGDAGLDCVGLARRRYTALGTVPRSTTATSGALLRGLTASVHAPTGEVVTGGSRALRDGAHRGRPLSTTCA